METQVLEYRIKLETFTPYAYTTGKSRIFTHDWTCVLEIFDVKYLCEIYSFDMTLLFGDHKAKNMVYQCENVAKTTPTSLLTTITIVHFTHFCTEHSYSIPLQFLLILLNNNRAHPVFAWSYICISWCESWLSSGYFRRFTHLTWLWSSILFRRRNRWIVIITTTKHLSVNC